MVDLTKHYIVYAHAHRQGVSVVVVLLKVKSMQRPGTEAIRTQIKPSKSKREITKVTKVIRHRNSDTKKQATKNHNKANALERSVINY